jgi:tRNA(Ile)-lysidine synthase
MQVSSLSKQLITTLTEYPPAQCYWVAFSGGVDSHVLLHALASNRKLLDCLHVKAIHINHQISEHCEQWADHCKKICSALSIPCLVIKVDVQKLKGDSPEAVARDVRYDALKNVVDEDDLLLLGHHQDDQAETLLLQLMRGSGPRGLSGIAPDAKFGRGILVRPLLNISRQDIYHYAKLNALQWIEDESNEDTRFDRNYLRHQIIPAIKERWPSATKTIARSAKHCAEATKLLDQNAKEYLEKINSFNGSNSDLHSGLRSGLQDGQALPIDLLKELSAEQCGNVLRYWIHSLGYCLPNNARLKNIIFQAKFSAVDASPLISWPGCEIRRYRNNLVAMPPLAVHSNKLQLHWDPKQPLAIESLGKLHLDRVDGVGIRSECIASGEITVRFRQGGEKCRPNGQSYSRTLKNLFQEYAIPPWMRNRIPIIYIDGKIAALADYFICEGFYAKIKRIIIFLVGI